jgi:hypothetical protein
MWIVNRLKKKNYFTYSAGDEKWLIIVKFNYYEPFDYSVGDTLTGWSQIDGNSLRNFLKEKRFKWKEP